MLSEVVLKNHTNPNMQLHLSTDNYGGLSLSLTVVDEFLLRQDAECMQGFVERGKLP